MMGPAIAVSSDGLSSSCCVLPWCVLQLLCPPIICPPHNVYSNCLVLPWSLPSNCCVLPWCVLQFLCHPILRTQQLEDTPADVEPHMQPQGWNWQQLIKYLKSSFCITSHSPEEGHPSPKVLGKYYFVQLTGDRAWLPLSPSLRELCATQGGCEISNQCRRLVLWEWSGAPPSTSIDRSAQSVKQVNDTLENFDNTTHTHQDKGQHIGPDTTEDFHVILQVLQDEHIFTPVPGHAHRRFKYISTDPLIKIKK